LTGIPEFGKVRHLKKEITMQMILLFYACFLFVGAFFGFKAGSKVSLIMGVISGLLIILGLYFMADNPMTGYILVTAVSGLLTIVFLIRSVKTRVFMPAGMLFSVSILIFFLSLYTVLGL